MQKLLLIVVAGVAGLVAVALAGVGRPEPARGADPPTGRSITVVGTGTVKTVPDQAAFTIGVESQAGTAQEALAANSSAMRRLLDALREAGLKGDDLQTQSVSVWPRTKEGEAVVGYTASNSVLATVDVAKAGDVVAAATAAGANQVWGPQLAPSDQKALYRQALEGALDDARVKAKALADAAGVSVGRVMRVVEQGSQPEPYAYSTLAARDAAAPPIEPGKVDTSASATVTFEVS